MEGKTRNVTRRTSRYKDRRYKSDRETMMEQNKQQPVKAEADHPGNELPGSNCSGALRAPASPGNNPAVAQAVLAADRRYSETAALEGERCATAPKPDGATAVPGHHPRLVSDVAELPAELRELVERMLTEGATFEDVYETMNERGAPVTLQAIQNLYRGSLELQKRRIQFQVERAQALKESLAHPESADAQLAYAAMLTGLQSLSRKDGGISLRDAIRGTLERRNIMLKRDLLRMRIAREEEEKRFRKTRLHAELMKLEMTKTKLAQLQKELNAQGKNKTLGPEAMEKIQEIYGLLRIPVIPRDVEAGE